MPSPATSAVPLRTEILPARFPAVHLFTVDVEDYFQVQAFEGLVSRDRWESYPSRVVSATERLLDLLARYDTRGTFFTLGWVAERYPGLVRRIAEAGHEVASHSYWHRRVYGLAPEEFRRDLREAKDRLENASGQPCLGFRAASFSIVPGTEWAFDILLEEGFRYDSSLFPIRRPDYGYPGAPLAPFRIERPGGSLLELPLATLPLAGLRLPAAGGGYLRQLSPALVHRAFRAWGEQGISASFYVHPWEVDPGQPRLPCGRITALRHYRNLGGMLSRLERLLSRFRFTSVMERFGELLAPAVRGARIA